MIWAFWHLSCQVFLLFPSLSSASGMPIMCMLYPLWLSLKLSSFFFPSLLSVCASHCIISIKLPDSFLCLLYFSLIKPAGVHQFHHIFFFLPKNQLLPLLILSSECFSFPWILLHYCLPFESNMLLLLF